MKRTLQNKERKYLKNKNYPKLDTNLSPQVGETNQVSSRKNKIKSMLRN